MKAKSTSDWRRTGSSIVFGATELTHLLQQSDAPKKEVLITSLRHVLGWAASEWPATPPDGAHTVVVTGLDAVLETMSVADGEAFLRKEVKGAIQVSQHHWTAAGLVFAFPVPPNRFSEDMDEHVLFERGAGGLVKLSWGLWNGAARDVWLLRNAAKEPVGYHVQRIS
jgi:hypothetical protein